MIVIKSITQVDGFKKLSPIWNPLLQKSGSNNVFSTFEWLYTWWKHFGDERELSILLAKEGEEVIGIAPLMIEKKRILRYVPIKVVLFIGTGISDYSDFIIVKEREKVLNLFFEYLQKRRNLWDRVDLREIREDSPNLAVIQDNLEKQGFIGNICEIGKCPYIGTKNEWSSYYSSLSKNFRQDIRTQYNRIEKNGLAYRIFSKEKEINNEFLGILIDTHLEGIAGKNKNSFLETEKGTSFLKVIVREFEKQGWVTINIVYIDEKVAAYALGFQYGNRYYYWNIGKDNRYDDFSPGKLLLHHMLTECFSNNTIKEFDLLRGQEHYKYRWTKLERKNYRITAQSDSLYSRTVFKVQGIYRSLIKSNKPRSYANGH